MSDRQIELSWTCPACARHVRGRFMACTSCGAPKPADVSYEMPLDTAAEPSVTDPELLALATAGANWRCSYCGSDQRKANGACAQCGAAAALSPQTLFEEVAASGSPAPDLLGNTRWLMWPRIGILAGGVLALLATVIVYFWWHNRERDYAATVASVRWKQSIIVERYKVWEREGFRGETSAEAFDVESLGQRVHHYDTVPDGYTTETYVEQTACGEDCTDSSPSCHEVCTNNRNGFASCHQECSGGGHSCHTRYCSETRTRQTPKFRQEPRYAEAVRYKIWDWGDDRTVDATGTSTSDLRWPEDEAHVGKDLAPRENERERRESHYEVTLRYGDDSSVTFPVSQPYFSEFAPGTHHDLDIQAGRYLVDHHPVTPAP